MTHIKTLRSRIKRLKKSSPDALEEIFSLYVELTKHIALNDYKRALKVTEEAIEHAQSMKSPVHQALFLNLKGIRLNRLSAYKEARKAYKAALSLFRKLDDRESHLGAIMNIGTTYVYEKEYKKAMKYLFQAADLAHKHPKEVSEELLTRIYLNIGAVYQELSLLKDAEKNYLVALKYSNKLKNKSVRYQIYLNLGSIYPSLNKYEEAKDYLRKAIRILNNKGDTGELALAYSSLSKVYLKQKDFRSAFKYAIKSLSVAEAYKSEKYFGYALEAILNSCKDYIPSESYYNSINPPYKFSKVLNLIYQNAHKNDDKEGLREIYELYSRYYVKIGAYKKALEYKDEVIKISEATAAYNAQKKVRIASSVKELKKSQKELDLNRKLLTKERSVNKRLQSVNKEIQKSNDLLTQKTDELNYVMSELEKLAFITSHDLKEPLRNMKGFLQILKQRYKATLDQEGLSYIDFSLSASERIKIIIEDLIHYLRLSTRKISFSPCDLSELLRQLNRRIATEYDTSEYKLSIQNDMPIMRADLEILNEMFYQLITNAIQYKRTKKAQINITAKSNKKKLTISVQDNGIGMNESYAEKVFQIFTRLDNNRTSSSSGIGLAICKKIMILHDGKIWFESVIGKGTTFYLEFPILKPLQDI